MTNPDSLSDRNHPADRTPENAGVLCETPEAARIDSVWAGNFPHSHQTALHWLCYRAGGHSGAIWRLFRRHCRVSTVHARHWAYSPPPRRGSRH